MTSKEMLDTYRIPNEQRKNTTFEKMLNSSMKMHELEPLTFKWCPFLEDAAQLTENAWGIFEQCVAIEKGWA